MSDFTYKNLDGLINDCGDDEAVAWIKEIAISSKSIIKKLEVNETIRKNMIIAKDKRIRKLEAELKEAQENADIYHQQSIDAQMGG